MGFLERHRAAGHEGDISHRHVVVQLRRIDDAGRGSDTLCPGHGGGPVVLFMGHHAVARGESGGRFIVLANAAESRGPGRVANPRRAREIGMNPSATGHGRRA